MMAVSLPCSHGDGRIKKAIDDRFVGLAGVKMGLVRFVASS
jgi:hypothetical protein